MLTVLRVRSIAVSDTDRERILSEKDPARLDRWHERAVGFKSLARQSIELGRLNGLIGANGSGKTALLEAIGLLGAAVSGRVDAGELKRRGVRSSAPRAFVTALERAPATKIRLGAESFTGASYHVTLAPPSGGPGDRGTRTTRAASNREVLLTSKELAPGVFAVLPDDVFTKDHVATTAG